MACSISPLWLKPGSHDPIFLHRLTCSQYILLPRCLVHHFAVSTEKLLHIFCHQTAAKVKHLNNLQIVSLMFLSPDKSILDVGMPLTREVQHVTSKKAEQLEWRRFRLQAFKQSCSPRLLSAPYMAPAAKTAAAWGGLCQGRGVRRVSAPLAACTTHHSPPTPDKSRPHSGPRAPSTRRSALLVAPWGIRLVEQAMTVTLCKCMSSSDRKDRSRPLLSLDCHHAGGDCFVPIRLLQQSPSLHPAGGELAFQGFDSNSGYSLRTV